jgi:hypothetical protein
MTNAKKTKRRLVQDAKKVVLKQVKRDVFASKLKVQQPKQIVFVATPEGTAKRLAHKSRWHD